MTNFSSREFRDALGCFATGVTVVTTNYQNTPLGMTVNSFTSVSLDPPLVLWCLAKENASYDVFSQAQFYNIQVLSEMQEGLSNQFAGTYTDKFDGAKWNPDQRGVPYLQGCKTTFHCEKYAKHEGGDHLILVGSVVEITEISGDKPLLFAQGKYSRLIDS